MNLLRSDAAKNIMRVFRFEVEALMGGLEVLRDGLRVVTDPQLEYELNDTFVNMRSNRFIVKFYLLDEPLCDMFLPFNKGLFAGISTGFWSIWTGPTHKIDRHKHFLAIDMIDDIQREIEWVCKFYTH